MAERSSLDRSSSEIAVSSAHDLSSISHSLPTSDVPPTEAQGNPNEASKSSQDDTYKLVLHSDVSIDLI